MYRVYRIDSLSYYSGISLVAAENANEANQYIRKFKEYDNGNRCNSFGYSFVTANDIMDGLFAEDKGIVYHGIYYRG